MLSSSPSLLIIAFLLALHLSQYTTDAFSVTRFSGIRLSVGGKNTASSSSRVWGVGKEAQRAWQKGDLSDKDIFDDGNDDTMDPKAKKEKMKLQPETIFYEGAPSPYEVLFPALSIVTIIGIVPFIAALSRQVWVKYKFTSRRVSIQSGFGGDTQTEIIYPDIEEVRFVYRGFGSSGDMVLFLKDGAKVELRFVPDFDRVLAYVLNSCDEECRAKSKKPIPVKASD